MINYLSTIATPLLFWLTVVETSSAANAPHAISSEPLIRPKRLLILHSYHQGLNWADAIQAGILESH